MNAHRVQHRRLAHLFIVVLILVLLLPIGVTLAQSGPGYDLTAVTAPLGEGVSSGGAYVLTHIDAWPSTDQSQGQGYLLASFTPDEPQASICVYLPVVLKRW